jgi:hypothetical protein
MKLVKITSHVSSSDFDLSEFAGDENITARNLDGGVMEITHLMSWDEDHGTFWVGEVEIPATEIINDVFVKMEAI